MDQQTLEQLRVRAREGAREDVDAAIEAHELVLDAAPDTDTILALAELYETRGAAGDAEQAAELFCTLGDVQGASDGVPMVERALRQLPSHDAAMELLERYVPEAEHPVRLREAWTAYIAHSENEAGLVQRRMSLARAHVAQHEFRDALVCLGPLVEKGESQALTLQASCLASLQGEEHRERAASLPPNGKDIPPSTLVGFRVPPGDPPVESVAVDGEQAARQARARARAKSGTLVGFQLPPKDGDSVPPPPLVEPEPVEPAVEPKAVAPLQAPQQAPPKQASDNLGPGAKAALLRASRAPKALNAETSEPAPTASAGPALLAAALREPAPATSAGPAALAAALREPAPTTSAGPAALAAALRASKPPQAMPTPVESAPPVSTPPPLRRAAMPVSLPPTTAVAIDAPPLEAPRRPKRWWLVAAALLVAGAIALAKFWPAAAPSSAPAATARGESVAPAVTPPAPAPAVVAPTPSPVIAAPAVATKAPVADKAKPTQAEHKLSAGKPSVRGGRLSPSQVRVALEDSLQEMQRCYDKARDRKKASHGRLTFAWTIDKAGRPSRVRKLNGTLKDAALERCTIGAIKEARFPKAKPKSAQVTWPITYPK